MNKYFVLATLVAFVAWSGFMYYEGGSKERAVCGQHDAQHDLAQAGVTVAAQNGVIATVGKQQTVTQGVDHEYQIKTNYIDSLYAPAVSSLRAAPTPAGHSLPAVARAAVRPHVAPAQPFVTAGFKLSAKECDENTEQLYGLQAWVKGQLAVK